MVCDTGNQQYWTYQVRPIDIIRYIGQLTTISIPTFEGLYSIGYPHNRICVLMYLVCYPLIVRSKKILKYLNHKSTQFKTKFKKCIKKESHYPMQDKLTSDKKKYGC